MRTSAESSEHTLSRLSQWLEQGGALMSKIQVVRQPDGERCVLARTDVSAGDILLYVPRSHMITLEAVQRSDLGRRLQAAGVPDNGHLSMAAFFLEEKQRPDSFWRPYFDSLPEDLSHLPRAYTEAEFAQLQGSQLLGLLESQRQTLREEYGLLCEKLPDFARFSFEQYAGARLLLTSRMCGHRGGESGPNCVPMVDMLNHRAPPDVLWTTTQEGDFVAMARHALSAGQEIHAYYGDKGNAALLLHYGFMTEDNPHDALYLGLGLPEGDALVDLKQRLLSLSSPTEPRFFRVSREAESFLSAPVLTFLRLAHADTGEMITLELPLEGPVSRACEARVLRALSQACEARLAAFETSLEEDETLLRDGALSANARTCIRLRRDEKRLLHHGLAQCRAALGLLGLSREEFERLADRSDTAWDGFEEYARGELLALVRREPDVPAGVGGS